VISIRSPRQEIEPARSSLDSPPGQLTTTLMSSRMPLSGPRNEDPVTTSRRSRASARGAVRSVSHRAQSPRMPRRDPLIDKSESSMRPKTSGRSRTSPRIVPPSTLTDRSADDRVTSSNLTRGTGRIASVLRPRTARSSP
jgi:hypothetical protein